MIEISDRKLAVFDSKIFRFINSNRRVHTHKNESKKYYVVFVKRNIVCILEYKRIRLPL